MQCSLEVLRRLKSNVVKYIEVNLEKQWTKECFSQVPHYQLCLSKGGKICFFKPGPAPPASACKRPGGGYGLHAPARNQADKNMKFIKQLLISL